MHLNFAPEHLPYAAIEFSSTHANRGILGSRRFEVVNSLGLTPFETFYAAMKVNQTPSLKTNARCPLKNAMGCMRCVKASRNNLRSLANCNFIIAHLFVFEKSLRRWDMCVLVVFPPFLAALFFFSFAFGAALTRLLGSSLAGF